jgi:hypothetical protein
VECVEALPAGWTRVYFGYENTSTKAVAVTLSHSVIAPAPSYRGQPQTFRPGRVPFAFSVDVKGTDATWTVAGTTAKSSYRSTACPASGLSAPELGSQSVSHSPGFHRLPLGTGAEAYGTYTPAVVDRATTVGATLLGELRVSRQLLEPLFQPKLESFRAPYLLASKPLAPALDATGYQQSSSTTQGWVQGTFPFHPPRTDGKGYADVYELPIGIEDEEGQRWGDPASRFDRRLAASRRLIDENGNNGAPTVLLVHPNGDTWKKDATTQLLAGLPDEAWVGTVGDFGAFWRARAALSLETYPSIRCQGGRAFMVTAPDTLPGAALAGQTLDIADSTLTRVMWLGGATQTIQGGKLVLPRIAAGSFVVGELCPT